jgi:hypothetical protein
LLTTWLLYSKSDQFGVGLILWSMLAPLDDVSALPYERERGIYDYVRLPPGCCNREQEALIEALTVSDPSRRLRVTDRPPAWSESRGELLFDT